jgi:hypothetical protein
MNEEIDRRTVGASDKGRRVLKWLIEKESFPSEMDAYRFAVSLGVSLGKRTPLVGRQTSFNIGSFDQDESVAAVIQTLLGVEPSQTYRAAEELAETGFDLIAPAMDTGEFRFEDMLEMAIETSPIVRE